MLGHQIHSWLPLLPLRGCSWPLPCWIWAPCAYPSTAASQALHPLCCCLALLRLQLSSVPSATLPSALGAFLSLSATFSGSAEGAQTWHPALGCRQVCAAEGGLCLAVCPCMRLVSLAHSAGLGQRWDFGHRGACAHGCCEANSWPVPTAKSINLQTVKIKGQTGLQEGFHVLFLAATPLNWRLLPSWVLRLVCF